ncbi:MAG: hypothetical protein ABI789_08365 [Usitatibacter sp.]
MIRFSCGLAGRFASLALALFSIAALTSCGSGAVSGSAPVNDPARITILPAIATAFSGLPTTFVISGGTGSYIVSSSNQSIVQVSGSLNGNTLTIIPNPVIADTLVTLTVRDTGTTPTVSASVTVRPGTVSNDITITPSSTQGTGCAPAICSGGDAEVSATISQGGVPLAARGVRFDAVSGDFAFVTSVAGATETLAGSIVVVTDETGKARARIRVRADAPNQTALLQVTDLGAGAFQRASFLIAQATGTSPGFFVSPSSATFQGSRADQCATTGISATFFVFGGIPPYSVSNTSSAFFVSPVIVSSSGGSFSVTPNGTCVDAFPIIVRDVSGRTTTVTVSNIRGTQPVPALVVGPSTVNLNSCTAVASVTASGGTGNYVASVGSGSVVQVAHTGSTFSFQRTASTATPGPITISISDGIDTVPVTVTLSGNGAGVCPTPGFAVSSNSVVLNDCAGAVQVILSGGSGTYNATSDSTRVTATVSGSILSIMRTAATGPFASGIVTATDGFSPIQITVRGDNAGSNACP